MAQSAGNEMGGERVMINNIYVKNLSEDVDDEDLHEMFQIFGRIISAKVMKTFDGKTRCCGFVNFLESESARKALEEMNGKEVKGKILYAGYAKKKAERQADLTEFEHNNIDFSSRYQGRNLYVKNLDDDIDDERLHNEFSQFGNITSAKVMTYNGKSKGFGFVCFSSTEDAIKAITVMNGRIVIKKPLYVAIAQRKEARRVHLATKKILWEASMRMQMEPMFPVAGAAYYIPTMPEGTQQSFFTPQSIPQMGAGLSWHAVGPNQLASEGGHQNMLAGAQVTPAGPAAPVQTSMLPSVSMSALTGQNASQPWSTMPVVQNNVTGHPIAVSMASQQSLPYVVNMFGMTGQNTQPWVTMPLTQNNVSGHPIAANVASQQGYQYKMSQPMLNMREADAENLHRPVISPSPPQRPLSIPPWSLPPSPRSQSPSPIPIMRFLAPPPQLPAEYLRPRLPMTQPQSSGMPRPKEPSNSQNTTLNPKKFEETDGANTISEEPEHLRCFLDVLDTVRQTMLNKMDLVIRREFVFEDLNRIYGGEEEPEILQHKICVEFEGEMGHDDSGGLTRYMFALYWNSITRFFFHGEAAKVPCVPKSRFLEAQDVFRAAGRILTHALLLTGSLPLDISVSFLWSAIKPSLPPADEIVLEDFCKFVSAAEARAIGKGLEGTAGVYSDVLMSQLMDMFARFGMNNIPSPKHFRQQVLNIAKVELIVKPSYFGQIMMRSIPNVWMTGLWGHISEYGLIEMYRYLQPTPQKVLQMLKTERDEEYLSNPQQLAFICLKDFISCLDSEALAQFLHFTTGSTSMPAEPILVRINNHTGLNRIPKAHNHGSVLEISTAYSSPLEFRHELGAIIFKDELYAMSLT